MSTKDLIDAIHSGDAEGIQRSFELAMSSRVADRLDAMRASVASNMFGSNEEVQVVETEESTEEQSEV